MYNSFLKYYFIIIIFLSISVCFAYTNTSINSPINPDELTINESNFTWPLPGNKNITSYFGNRKSPTNGASSYHSGLDIAATEGTDIHACFSGQVTYAGFSGAGGYSITVTFKDYQASYCHVSPNYLHKLGDYIRENDIIAKVGPKNVYNVKNNPYKDSNGQPTNGATTGCHLHLTIKKNKKAIDPLQFFK